MALFVRQDENRSELQKQVATQIQERARAKAKEAELPDGITDSAYIKGTKQTTGLAWLWAIVSILGVGVVIYLMIKSGS